jgi:hypothetical protein
MSTSTSGAVHRANFTLKYSDIFVAKSVLHHPVALHTSDVWCTIPATCSSLLLFFSSFPLPPPTPHLPFSSSPSLYCKYIFAVHISAYLAIFRRKSLILPHRFLKATTTVAFWVSNVPGAVSIGLKDLKSKLNYTQENDQLGCHMYCEYKFTRSGRRGGGGGKEKEEKEEE